MADEPRPPADVDVQDGNEAGAAAITRVAEHVLPALIARLTASELGEIEVSQAGWRVRLRRDGSAVAPPAGGPGRGMRALPGSGTASSNSGAGGTAASSTGSAGSGGQAASPSSRSSVVRRAAVAPAVGYFTPRDGLATGQAVRSGDVLGAIDVLGVTHPLIAPTDGVVGRVLASVGEAVEYGQELVRIDGIERLAES